MVCYPTHHHTLSFPLYLSPPPSPPLWICTFFHGNNFQWNKHLKLKATSMLCFDFIFDIFWLQIWMGIKDKQVLTYPLHPIRFWCRCVPFVIYNEDVWSWKTLIYFVKKVFLLEMTRVPNEKLPHQYGKV